MCVDRTPYDIPGDMTRSQIVVTVYRTYGISYVLQESTGKVLYKILSKTKA